METESEVEVPLSRVVRGAGPDDVEISGADAGEGQSVTPTIFTRVFWGRSPFSWGGSNPPTPVNFYAGVLYTVTNIIILWIFILLHTS